jgi:membrane associated rhomboid family serine protease
MFLHANNAHLWGNMLFLWAFGTVLEKRIGSGRFLKLYLLTGILSVLFGILINALFVGEAYHCLGASGAISGIMGIYAVRCYFKTLLMPLPLLGIFSLLFSVYLKVRVNALVLIGLFFLIDVGDGVETLAGVSNSNVAHWVHVGGMLAGVVLGTYLKLGRPAIAERHAELSRQSRPEGGFGSDAKCKSLQKVLEIEPENLEATLELARVGDAAEFALNSENLYTKAIKGYLPVDRFKAAEIFKEYVNKVWLPIEPELHYRLCGYLVQLGDLPTASRFLGMLVDDESLPASLREKAMFQVGKLLYDMEMPQAAEEYFQLFLERFPQSVLAAKVRRRLGVS